MAAITRRASTPAAQREPPADESGGGGICKRAGKGVVEQRRKDGGALDGGHLEARGRKQRRVAAEPGRRIEDGRGAPSDCPRNGLPPGAVDARLGDKREVGANVAALPRGAERKPRIVDDEQEVVLEFVWGGDRQGEGGGHLPPALGVAHIGAHRDARLRGGHEIT